MEFTPTMSTTNHIWLAPTPVDVEAPKRNGLVVPPSRRMYVNILVAVLQSVQFGWSTSQMNNSIFNNEADCNARPVAPGTCLMFPGHTKSEWTIAVSSWIVGGMIGSLLTGRVSNKFGRKPTMMANCIFMIVGALVQATSSTISIFTIGRFFAGIAAGGSTAVIPGFIGEICPPHLRCKLGVCFQISITVGHLLVAVAFFFASTSLGWRFIAAFPVVLAFLFLVLAPFVLVESPAWLLTVGQPARAEIEMGRLYGSDNVFLTKNWMTQDEVAPRVGVGSEYIMPMQDLAMSMSKDANKQRSFTKLFSPAIRRQLLVAIGVAGAQQLTGINAVFLYSSGIFKQAGLADGRIGVVLVNFVNVLPTLFCGLLSARFGNRKLILFGFGGMFLSAAGMTASLVGSAPAFAIVFTALYVTTFGSSLGPLSWGVMADLFPDDVRAMGCSICVGCSWLCSLSVGVGYPYIAATFGNYSFVPFLCTVTMAFLFVQSYVPETYGKTIQQIQDEFQARRNQKSRSSQIAVLG
ncbi:unnamed protein product [Hyaloperonospora brassicae]|uniref:Hexose transporter 1 n=1 Tax=Hyaloperonospora brassicae TaxID=162125 RepID=A0AAV0U4C6_HYABA|nr:unnamed protein product [Hyaloperonospora brassicae]